MAKPRSRVKPDTPGPDRAEQPGVPAWRRHWPRSVETSGGFDRDKEFNF